MNRNRALVEPELLSAFHSLSIFYFAVIPVPPELRSDPTVVFNNLRESSHSGGELWAPIHLHKVYEEP